MESATAVERPPGAGAGEKGLKKGAIGFVSALVIGLASTAPAYSLAAVIGFTVAEVGPQAPAVLLASFVPMFLIASAYFFMNRADPDCGTTFTWVTSALGPWAGWLAGWAICVTGILVIGSLAEIASIYTYSLLGLDGLAESKAATIGLAVLFIAAMTAIGVIGTELSARVQVVMIVAQVAALILFSVVALYLVFAGTAPDGAETPTPAWFSPLSVDSFSALTAGLLIGVFIYWGWESAVTVNEETENPTSAPGRAAVLSTVILLGTYVAVAAAVVAFAGASAVAESEDESILATLATGVLGSPLDKLVVLAILTSALAATQTTILPSSRTALSMARAGAMPRSLGRVHPRFLTPHVATIAIGVLATAWYVGLSLVSDSFLGDSLLALSLMIAFYYSLTGLACAVYYRRELLKSARNLVFVGIAPVVGAVILAALFVLSVRGLSDPELSESGSSWLGLGPPLVIGGGFLILGAVLSLVWRVTGHREFFARRAVTADPATAPSAARAEQAAAR